MRRKGWVFAIVGVIVALSVLTLSVGDIDIPRIERKGQGPLGLTLGLDLQGGSHLVYRANLPDEVRVTFEDPVAGEDLQALLNDVGQTDAVVMMRIFNIAGLDLEGVARVRLRNRLNTEVALVDSLTGTGDQELVAAFVGTADEADVLFALVSLGYADATAELQEDGTYLLANLAFDFRAEEDLRLNLNADLAPVAEMVLTDVEATGDKAFDLAFEDTVDEAEILSLLVRRGYVDAIVTSPPQERFRIQELALNELARDELELAMGQRLAPIVLGEFVAIVDDPTADQMDGVVNTIFRRVNAIGTTEPIIQKFGDDRVIVQLPGVGGSTIIMTFRPAPGAGDLQVVLGALGRTGDRAERTGIDTYVITTPESLSQEERDTLEVLLGRLLGAPSSFEATGDNQIALTFPQPPDTPALDLVAQEFGLTDYTIDRASGLATFSLRTEGVLATDDQKAFQAALESRIGAELLGFDSSGGIEEAKDLIGGTAQLVFKERSCEDVNCLSFRDTDVGLTGQDLNTAFSDRDTITNAPLVSIQFNSRGRDIFRELTTRLAGDPLKRIAIFLDDVEVSAPTVQSPIPNGVGQISGGFTRDSARRLAIQLESGRLPVPLELIGESAVDAFLGEDSLKKSLTAGLVGLGLVLLFMLVYYRMAGVVAATSLVIYAVIVLAILKLVPVTLVLSGMAGLVLSIGMAVDANILIFERMKEEMRTGRTLASATEAGFRRARSAIIDSNVSTMITCAILFFFGSRLGAGTPVVTGFAVTLLIGVAVSMFTAMVVSRNLLQVLALSPVGKRMGLFTPEALRPPVPIAGGRA